MVIRIGALRVEPWGKEDQYCVLGGRKQPKDEAGGVGTTDEGWEPPGPGCSSMEFLGGRPEALPPVSWGRGSFEDPLVSSESPSGG